MVIFKHTKNRKESMSNPHNPASVFIRILPNFFHLCLLHFFFLWCIRANSKYIISTVKSWECIVSSKVSFFPHNNTTIICNKISNFLIYNHGQRPYISYTIGFKQDPHTTHIISSLFFFSCHLFVGEFWSNVSIEFS